MPAAGREASTSLGTNRIDRGLRRGEHPQSVRHGADAPTGLVGTDDRTPAHLVAQRRIGRGGAVRRPMGHLRQSARLYRQAPAFAEDRRGLLQGHPELRMQQHDEGDRARPRCTLAAPNAFEVCNG
jgi:hypothetical protein